jgi:hypothetical protein
MRTYKKKTRKIKTRKQKTRKHGVIKNKQKINKKQKGGTNKSEDEKTMLKFIIDSNEVDFLNADKLYNPQGIFSIFLKVINNNNSPYKKCDYSNYGKDANCLLIKLVALIDYPENYLQNNGYKYWNEDNNFKKAYYDIKNFENEVNIQKDIFKKTSEYFEPICPEIVYYDNENNFDIINKLILHLNEKYKNHNDTNTTPIMKKIFDNITTKFIKKEKVQIDDKSLDIKLGIIVMEIGENFKPLSIFQKHLKPQEVNNEYETCKIMAKTQLYKMIFKTGYYHNDFHENNFLIDYNYEGMYKNQKGKVLIIDFGFSIKANENIVDNEHQKPLYLPDVSNLLDKLSIKQKKELYICMLSLQIHIVKNPKEIQNVFNDLYNFYRPDKTKFKDNKFLYEWIIDNNEENIKNINKQINTLLELEEKQNKMKDITKMSSCPDKSTIRIESEMTKPIDTGVDAYIEEMNKINERLKSANKNQNPF